MKILITGSGGFIGYHLSKYLLEKKFEVVGLDSLNDYYSPKLKLDRLKLLGIKAELSKDNTSYQSSVYANFKFYKCDISDFISLTEIFRIEQFDVIFNLAAQAGVRNSIINPSQYINSNVSGFLNILECAKDFNCKNVFYASSSSVYGKNEKQPFSEEDRVESPLNMYAVTKRTNELMAYCYTDLYNIKTIGLRFFTVYGPWGRPDMAPILFAKSILNGELINIFNQGKMERDFTYVDDIVYSLYKLLLNVDGLQSCELFNIGCNHPVNLEYFISTLEVNLNRKAIKNYLPMQMGDVKSTWADTSKISKVIGYEPDTNIEIGVKSFTDWISSYGLDNL